MKKIILLFLFLPILLFAQNETIKLNRFQIGVNFSPDLCYRMLSTQNANDGFWINIRNKNEGSKFGLTSGLTLYYKLSSRFTIGIGALYSNKGYKIKRSDWMPPTNSIDYFLPVANSKFRYSYLDIPLIIQYRILNFSDKFSLSTSLAGTFNFIISKQLIIHDSKNKSANTLNISDFNNINFSGNISIDFAYQLNSKFKLSLSPTYRYSFMPIYKSTVKDHLYSIGLNTGLIYQL